MRLPDLTVSGLGARILRTRWLVRAPIPLYRAGLGRLFGRRVLMLEHIGRKSGLPRYVCLEVVDRPAPDRLLIVSGFGTRSDWYRNLKSHPKCFVSWGRIRCAPAVARFLTEDESRAALERYATRYPASWRALRTTIEKAVGTPVDTLPMVELTLASRGLTDERIVESNRVSHFCG
ncbi:nitroreductase family deazaflavin-dependent oxidoreductase [Agromyces soli]